jgi:hypothetical protein
VNNRVREHLLLQAGVISRRQAVATGLAPHDLRRLLRRRDWALVHPGVYVAHTGPLTWLQRAWAGVLFSWPAALSHDSAMRAGDGPGQHDRVTEEVIHVAVDRRRTTLVAPAGIRVHHVVRLHQLVQWNLGPPRLRYEEAALAVAAQADSDFAAIAAWRRRVSRAAQQLPGSSTHSPTGHGSLDVPGCRQCWTT